MPEEERRSSRAFLAALLAVTAAVKLCLAWAFPGFLSGDDLEIVATAAKYAVGLDYEPWRIRCLLHPLLLAFPVVKAGALAGLASPRWLTLLAAVPTAAFSTLGVWLAYRAARALDAPETTARVAALLAATAWVPFAYGGTQYPRPISSALLVGAFVLLVRRGSSSRDAALAGVLAAAAFAVRWSEGMALVPLTALAWARSREATSGGHRGPREATSGGHRSREATSGGHRIRREATSGGHRTRREATSDGHRSPREAASGRHRRGFFAALALLAGFAAGALLFVGIFDALTWGAPFASLRAFLAFLRAPHDAFLPRPFRWYLGLVLQWAGPVVVLLCLFGARDRRAREPLVVAAGFVALLSPSPLKALRYVMFAVLLLAVAAAFGWERLRGRGRAGRAAAALCLAISPALCAERTWHLMREKSQPAIAAARFLAARNPRPRSVLLQQQWAWGERLYLGNGVRIVNVRPGSLDAGVAADARGVDAAGVYAPGATPEFESALRAEGLMRCREFAGDGPPVVVYLRSCGAPSSAR